MVDIFKNPLSQFESAAGVPLSGATLEFYVATTTTPITVYQDYAMSTPWGTSVTADSSGLFGAIYVNEALFKIILKNAAGTIIKTVDNIAAGAAASTSFADDVFRVTDNLDATKKLAFQVSGVTAGQTRTVTVPDASGTMAYTTDITTATNNAKSRRNRLVNPAMQISSVNGNTSGTANGYAPADNWATFRVTSAGTITTQRVQSVTPKGAKDRIRVTITAADASLAAGEYLTVTQAIIGQEVADFQYGGASAKQTVLRFLFKGPAGTYAVRLINAASNRSYVALFTPAVANTDEIISLVIPGDVTGTWTTDGTTGLTLDIVLACGSTFQGTTGWQSGNIMGTSAVSNGMGTISQVFEIGEAGLYLDPDSTGVAPAWELPSAAMEIHNTAGGDVGRLLAWVNFNGTGTVAIRASGNVSSITDNGAGDYTVNFTTPLPDANYVANITTNWITGANIVGTPALAVNGSLAEVAPTASALRFITVYPPTATAYDSKYVHITIVR